MASSKEGMKLDKSTPDSVWKQVLSAEEVSASFAASRCLPKPFCFTNGTEGPT